MLLLFSNSVLNFHINNVDAVKLIVETDFLVCPKPRDLDHGYYNEDRANRYFEGQKVSFSCNNYANRIPSDGIIECGSNGWNIDHWCSPFVPSKYIGTIYTWFQLKTKMIKCKVFTSSNSKYL